jgi:hypothetical protein
MSFARPSLATQVLTSVNLYILYFVIGPLKASARVAIKLGIMLLQTGYKYQVYNHQSSTALFRSNLLSCLITEFSQRGSEYLFK